MCAVRPSLCVSVVLKGRPRARRPVDHCRCDFPLMCAILQSSPQWCGGFSAGRPILCQQPGVSGSKDQRPEIRRRGDPGRSAASLFSHAYSVHVDYRVHVVGEQNGAALKLHHGTRKSRNKNSRWPTAMQTHTHLLTKVSYLTRLRGQSIVTCMGRGR